MSGLRVLGKGPTPEAACCRCKAVGCPWDQIAGKSICPDCQEGLLLGVAPPLQEPVERKPCALCYRVGVLRYVTFPLGNQQAVEMDLCGGHLQDLLARRLDAATLQQLENMLNMIGLSCRQLFLLHEAFYDEQGHSLQPIPEEC